MSTFYRIAANSIQADEDRQKMGAAGLQKIVTIPYSDNQTSRYVTFAEGEIRPGVVLPCAILK